MLDSDVNIEQHDKGLALPVLEHLLPAQHLKAPRTLSVSSVSFYNTAEPWATSLWRRRMPEKAFELEPETSQRNRSKLKTHVARTPSLKTTYLKVFLTMFHISLWLDFHVVWIVSNTSCLVHYAYGHVAGGRPIRLLFTRVVLSHALGNCSFDTVKLCSHKWPDFFFLHLFNAYF